MADRRRGFKMSALRGKGAKASSHHAVALACGFSSHVNRVQCSIEYIAGTNNVYLTYTCL